MTSLAYDLREVCRTFRRDRAYAFTVMLTLALTVGATTAVFSIVNGVLLKPLAYREAHRLVALREIWREFANRYPTLEVNERHFDYWRAHATSFESLAQYFVRPSNLTGGGAASQINVVRSSGSLFDVLQVRASMGRLLNVQDEAEGAPEVAVITDSFWRRQFHADTAVAGRTLVLDGKPYAIVGVLPPAFRLPQGEQLTAEVDAAIPLRITVGWIGDFNNQAIGRLRRGVTVERARAELNVLQRQISELAAKEAHGPVTLASAVVPLAENIAGRSRRALLLLLAAVGSVLLIACSNLANLSLTRTLGRVREAAIRSALGASRRRLVRRVLLEQLVLSVAGGAVGLWVAWLALAFFVRTAPVDLPRIDEVTIDLRVVAFAAAISLVAGLLVTIVSARRTSATDVQSTLRTTVLTATGDRGARRTHAALLALQVALSVTLLVVTALFAISFTRVLNLDLGFKADRVLAVDVALPGARYDNEPLRQAAYDRLRTAVHQLPGVEDVTTTSMLPLAGEGQVNFMAVDGSHSAISELPTANFRFVAPEYFRTLGIPIVRGRAFTDAERDPQRPTPVVISEPTAKRLWASRDPVGRRFSRGIPGEQGFEVVGVVGDARVAVLDRAPPLMVYAPYWWRSRPSMSLLIKTAVDPSSMLSAVRRAVLDVDPDIAVGQSRTLQQLVDSSLAGRRYQTQLFTTFGAVAMLIAIVGVYAVTAYGVSRRRREMNIRVALGAHTSQVKRMLLRQGAMPVIAGVAAGTAGALAVGGVIAGLLFEVRARDPIVIASVAAVVASVALLTCGLATRQALSLNPAAALRDE